MKTPHIAMLLLLAGAVVPMLAGCQETEDVLSSETASSMISASVSEGETDASYYPVTITTHNYAKEPVEIQFEKAPERVICYSLNSVENMIALGLEDRIILAMGIEEEEVLPEYQEALKNIDRIQSEFITKEEAVGLQPDFILAWYSSFGEDRLGDVDFWHERDIMTYMAYNSGLGDQNLQNEYDDILNLGRIFHVEDRAEALVAQMQEKVQQGWEYAQGKTPVRVAILEDEGNVFRVYGENSIGGDIAAQVGAELVAKDKNVRLSAEDLVKLNPEMIFSIHFGENSTSLNPENCLDVFQNAAFQNMDAVKSNRLYPTDLSLVYAPGVRVSKSIDFFLEHLYPEYQSEEQ